MPGDERYESYHRRLTQLEARADRAMARAAAFMGRLDDLEDVCIARYALVLEEDGFEFLMEIRQLRKPPRVRVRRGAAWMELWLDEDDTSVIIASGLSRFEERRVVSMVRDRLEELRDAWFNLKQDERRSRLRERHILVD